MANQHDPGTLRRVRKTDLKEQVEQELLRFIRQMDLSVSHKLPREEELSRMLGVSRITLRSVLDDLAGQGMIFRRHGRGTFVNPGFFEMKVSFNPVRHYSDMIRSSGYEPSVQLLDWHICGADQETAVRLRITPGTEVLRCDKLFRADRQLCAVVRDYIPVSYLNGASPDGLERDVDSVFYFMYKATGRKLVWDQAELNAVYSAQDEFLDGILREAGRKPQAFLLLKAVCYDEEETAAVYTLEYVDTTILKFSQIRKKILHYDSLETEQ